MPSLGVGLKEADLLALVVAGRAGAVTAVALELARETDLLLSVEVTEAALTALDCAGFWSVGVTVVADVLALDAAAVAASVGFCICKCGEQHRDMTFGDDGLLKYVYLNQTSVFH